MNSNGGNLPLRHGYAELIKAGHDISGRVEPLDIGALMRIGGDPPFVVKSYSDTGGNVGAWPATERGINCHGLQPPTVS